MAMIYLDKNGVELREKDVIDIHQTVNGQSLFVVHSFNPLRITYYNTTREYEYDCESLLAPFEFDGEVEWEILYDTKQQKTKLLNK